MALTPMGQYGGINPDANRKKPAEVLGFPEDNMKGWYPRGGMGGPYGGINPGGMYSKENGGTQTPPIVATENPSQVNYKPGSGMPWRPNGGGVPWRPGSNSNPANGVNNPWTYNNGYWGLNPMRPRWSPTTTEGNPYNKPGEIPNKPTNPGPTAPTQPKRVIDNYNPYSDTQTGTREQVLAELAKQSAARNRPITEKDWQVLRDRGYDQQTLNGKQFNDIMDYLFGRDVPLNGMAGA